MGGALTKLRSLAGNIYLYPFMMGWASLHVALSACHVLGIVAKKLGYDAVTANLLSTVRAAKQTNKNSKTEPATRKKESDAMHMLM